jgi:arginine N-succinyltransferase
MFRIRPIRESDKAALKDFAEAASLGITNLPKHEERREHFLSLALAPHPKSYYLFLLENDEDGTALGVCGIFPRTTNLDYFKIQGEPLSSYYPESLKEAKTLERIQYAEGPTEICSLYLSHPARKEGLGKLLSYSRFYFMKAFPELFSDVVYAEMRGVIDENGDAPFWDALGRRFAGFSYRKLMDIIDHGDRRAKDLIPSKTVYVDLLDPKGREAIGKTHLSTTPAFKMLEEQNFIFSGEIDLFDGGPRLVCKRENIATILNSRRLKVVKVRTITGEKQLVSNAREDFRVTIGQVEKEGDGAAIDPLTAQAIEVGIGDDIIAIL